MELPKLVVELVGDYSRLLNDIKEARQQALKQVQLLEKELVISPSFSINPNEIRKTAQTTAQIFQEGLKANKIDITQSLTFNQNTIQNLGRQVSAGLAQGINSNASQAAKASNSLSGLVIDETRKRLRIKSPSQEFRDIGKSIIDGLAQGLGIGGGLSITNAIANLIGGVINAARTAAQTGLNFTGDSIVKYSELKAIESQLTLIEGSANSLKFIREESDRLSLALANARQGYISLAAAARGTKLQDDVKDIFSALSAAARVFNLSNEQYSGAITAIEQIISKNRVSAEELRGQLSERLPGAFQIAARSLGITTAQLDKLLSTGQLTADVFLPRFAAQLKKELGQGVEAASNNTNASLTRLQNQVISLQESLGKAIEPGVIAGLNFIQQVLTNLGQENLFDDLNKGALDFSEYLKQNPQIAKETAQAIAHLARDGIKLAVDSAKSLLDYLRENPNAIKDATNAIGDFGRGLSDAISLAKELVRPFAEIFSFVTQTEAKLRNVQREISQRGQDNQTISIDQVSPPLRPLVKFSQFLGLNKNIIDPADSLKNLAIASPIQGVSIDKLVNYRPTQGQGFYGIRDGGKRRHSKVDFDSRVGGGEGAIAQAALAGVATMRKLTSTSGGVNIDSLGQDGRKITLEYNHLRLDDLRRLFGNQKQINVSPGQQLARITNDALSTGAHLDFGVKINGSYIDPQKFLANYSKNFGVLSTNPNLNKAPFGPPVPNPQQLAQITQNQQQQQKQAVTSASNWMNTKASFYGQGDGFDGKPTASGERFDKNALTTAINENLRKQLGLKFGDRLEVTNPQTGRSTVVRINDHGPYERRNGKFVPHSSRGLDLAYGAAQAIGITQAGVADIKFRVLGKTQAQTLAQAQNSTLPQQQPPEVQAILQQQQERDRINRRNAVRQSQDLIQNAQRAARDSAQGSVLFPTQDERNARQAQQRLQQIDDQIVGLQRQKEDAQSRITINQSQISSGSLSPDVVGELNNQISLDDALIKELDNSLKSLQESRRKTSEEYAKFNERDRQFREQQADLRVFQSSNEILSNRITNLRELAKLNPNASELTALPELERELALNQQQLKVGQELLNLNNARDRSEITPEEYTSRLDALRQVNDEELRTIELRHRLAQANEILRQSQLKVNQVLQENNANIERLRLGAELRTYGIGTGDRFTISREADRLELKNSYLQSVQQLQERTMLEGLTPDQFKGERLRLALRYNERKRLIDEQFSRNLDDLSFSESARVSESKQSLLSGQSDYLQLFGLDTKSLQKQAAILSQNLDFKSQIRDLQRLKDAGDMSAEAFAEVKRNLEALNQVKLDSINAQFNNFADVIRGVKSDTEGIFKDFLLGTKTLGESLMSIFQSILNNLATMASKMLSDQLFASIFGRGQTPNFNPNSGGGFNLLGTIGSIAGGLFGGGSSGYGFGSNSVFGGSFNPVAFEPSLATYADIGNLVSGSFASGDMVGDLAKGLSKERALSGYQPHLIIANEGERVLNPEETRLWNSLQASGKLPSFSSGGMVGGDRIGSITNLGQGDTFNVSPVIQVPSSSPSRYDLPRFEKVLEAKVQQVIREERRPGGSISRGGLYDR